MICFLGPIITNLFGLVKVDIAQATFSINLFFVHSHVGYVLFKWCMKFERKNNIGKVSKIELWTETW